MQQLSQIRIVVGGTDSFGTRPPLFCAARSADLIAANDAPQHLRFWTSIHLTADRDKSLVRYFHLCVSNGAAIAAAAIDVLRRIGTLHMFCAQPRLSRSSDRTPENLGDGLRRTRARHLDYRAEKFLLASAEASQSSLMKLARWKHR